MSIDNKTKVAVGVVPTHLKFVGTLVPDENGKLPRTRSGILKIVSGMRAICKSSPVKLKCVQVPLFPGADSKDLQDLFKGMKALKLEVHLIMMVGGANPINPKDEDAVAEMLCAGLEVAKKYKVKHVSSTSYEEWLSGKPLKGKAYANAVQQVVKLHARCYKQAGLEKSPVQGWHLEFLRGVEFQNFTNAAKAAEVVKAINKKIRKKFFKVMIDAAHCGDSDLSISENEAVIKDLAKADALGIFHASAKTTRGCFSTDDGWISALLAACAETGKLEHVFIELFHHEDAALEPLRKLVKGHGVDTTDGRTYDRTVVDGIIDVTRRLNNLKARKVIK
ncbi:MAG: hypothetical protein VW576_10310 [Opitutae bacterium]